jgi:tetratricopeptide (TPR) repeat protein
MSSPLQSSSQSSSKKNRMLQEYFKTKSWLIVESSATTRNSLKKTLSHLGSKINHMLDASNMAEALGLIETKKPHFVIANNRLTGGDVTSLFHLHSKIVSNRLNGGFFVMAQESAIADIALSFEYDMDGIIALPFSGFTVVDSILKSVQHKLSPTPYLIKIEEGRSALLRGNPERASVMFETAITLHKHPYEAFFFMGQIYKSINLIEKAIRAYEESVLHNNSYFRSLNSLSKIYYEIKDYKNAYDMNFLMAQKFPTPPAKIPELIHLSIINKKYDDVSGYLKLFQERRAADSQTEINLSAGLAVLGKHLLSQRETNKAVEALRSAFKYSNGKYEILESLMRSFQECGKMSVLLRSFEETNLSLWPENVQGLYFYTFHKVSDDDLSVLSLGEKLLRKKVKDVYLYRGFIERGIKMNRKLGNTENIVLQAIKNFPDERALFENLLEVARKKQSV